MTSVARPRVVILGGGFGGLSAARALAGVAVDVTLIDRRNYHLFQPLLYQVATAGPALRPSAGRHRGRATGVCANLTPGRHGGDAASEEIVWARRRAESHVKPRRVRTELTESAELEVRIHSPPPESPQTFSSSPS